VHSVGGRSVFVDDIVVHRPKRSDAIHERSDFWEMFANPHIGNRSADAVVVGAGKLAFRVTRAFWIESVDLRHAAAEPD
jgi:hypothetical protein